jgi:hypothetical protein
MIKKIRFRDDYHYMSGEFTMRVYRHVKGEKILIETYEDHNLIVDSARAAVARLIAGDGTGKTINRIAFGTSGAVPTPDNTAITGAFVKTFIGHSYPVTGQVLFSWNLLTTEANGKGIREFGLLCADNTLFARKTRTKPLEKDSDISLEGEWLIIL